MFLGASLGMALATAPGPNAVEVTIYNQGFALVKEVRMLDLKAGRQSVAIEDVAQRIEASSVGIRSVSAPGSFEVLEQNYQYDLISPIAILNKAVGQSLVFNRVLPNGTKERIAGVLLSAPTAIVSTQDRGSYQTYGGMVIRTDDGRILLNPSGEVEVAAIPDGLISKPTLLWDIDAEKGGSNTVELSYLTQGMTWNADYVLNLDGMGRTGDLKGWVTLNNSCGTTYRDAKLKLLAGDVQRVQPMRGGGVGGGAFAEMRAKDAGFAEEQFADYHLYTLQRPATVRNNEIKQVSLLESTGIPVKKRLVVDAMRNFKGYRPNEGEVGTGPIKPQIRIEFTNDKASKLGMPLPMGKIKVFQRDSAGALQMLGEDQIDHTPKDERLSLVVGHAFDIVAERKRTLFEWIRHTGGNIRGARQSFEIEVRNRKETPESVDVLERFWGEYKVTQKNMDFKQLDSETLLFALDLKAGETKKIVFTVENYW